MDIQCRSFTFEARSIDGQSPLPIQISEPRDPSRVRRFRASDDTLDRYNEVILPEAWDVRDFVKNPVMMLYHDYRTLPIGKAVAVGVRDGALYIDAEFDPEHIDEEADKVLRKIDYGTVSAGSVGFIPMESKSESDDRELFKRYPGARRIYTKASLLEWTITPVPANPNALAAALQSLALRGFGPSPRVPERDEADNVNWEQIKAKVNSLTERL